MPSTLQQAIKALEGIKIDKKIAEAKLAQKLCGKYKGAIPQGIISTEFIRQELRGTLYGKIEADS
ncbi:MAG: hypothetical protein KAU38_15450 [Desulfobacterales bacterium]|nr:hypothetical protein [Desulfobacterales bacterium]